ncbi:MAG: hypothetical protein IPP47_03000 [Bryobacterales bacterium]|nr:hypothetical protein [Bryobacterales bacterium]
MLQGFRRMMSGAGLACLLVPGLALPVFGQGIFNQNLVVNPGAEAGAGMTGSDQEPVKDVPGWTLTGPVTVAKYSGDSFNAVGDYGPVERGANYFISGSGGGKALATQTIDLSVAAAEIDAGRVRYYVAGYLGSHAQMDFLGGVKAEFQDAAGKVLLTSTIRGPVGDEGNYPGALLSRSVSGFLLPNTRSVVLTLDMTAPEADHTGFSADNLSLVLAAESIMGVNLVVNGDAETPNDSLGSTGNATPVVGWNAPPSMYVTTYDDARLGAADPGPENRGQYLLIGTGGGTGTRFHQAIDVTLAKDLIDGGGVTFGFSAYLGGYQDSADTAEAKVEFLDEADKSLGEAALTVVTLEDRKGAGGMLLREANGPMPVGTRRVRVTVVFGGTGDAAFLGYALADNIRFTMVAPAAELRIKDNGIVNAASGAAGAVAAGEIVNVQMTGVDLNSVVRMQLDQDGKVSKELGGVKLYFDGTQAPLLYVNSSEVRGIVPFDVEKKASVEVRLEYKGVKSNTVTMTVAPTAPAVFTQEGTPKGAGLIYDAGWNLVSAANPAAKGSTVTVIWTGGGQTNPDGVDGRIEMQSLPRPKAAVTAKIGGQTATVRFAGAVPFGWAGLLMAQIDVPTTATAGNVLEVLVTAGAATSPGGVTIAVK